MERIGQVPECPLDVLGALMENVGDTWWWKPPGTGGTPHRYIALTDPAIGRFVAVNLTHANRGGNAFLIKAGQHGCTKDSEVNFGDALIVETASVYQQLDRGYASSGHPLPHPLVREIAEMGKTHPAVSREIQRLLKGSWIST